MSTRRERRRALQSSSRPPSGRESAARRRSGAIRPQRVNGFDDHHQRQRHHGEAEARRKELLDLLGTAEGVAIAIVIVVVVLGVQLTADRYSAGGGLGHLHDLDISTIRSETSSAAVPMMKGMPAASNARPKPAPPVTEASTATPRS